MTAATAHAAAQGAAASSAAVHGTTTEAGGARAGNNAEEEQINGFLHAPAVKALARFLHLSLGTTDSIFLDLNYLIILAAIGIPLVRFMPKVMRKRVNTLQHNLESARKLTEEATARMNSVEAQLAKLGEDIDKFRSEVEAELKNDEARIKGSIEEESGRIVAAAEQEIALAAVQAQRGLRRFAAELAVEHARKQLVLSPQTDHVLLSEFARSIAENRNGSAGGQH